MTERTCRNCRWWESQDDMDDFLPETIGFGWCVMPESKMTGADRGGDEAGILTAPDFGCVQWEEKK